MPSTADSGTPLKWNLCPQQQLCRRKHSITCLSILFWQHLRTWHQSTPVEMPRGAWMTIPVPAMGEPEVVAAVQEPWRDNQRHARQYRRAPHTCGRAWSVATGVGMRLTARVVATRPPKAGRAMMPMTGAWGRMRIAVAARASVARRRRAPTGGIAPCGARSERCGSLPIA
jgi:hypothetical protein